MPGCIEEAATLPGDIRRAGSGEDLTKLEREQLFERQAEEQHYARNNHAVSTRYVLDGSSTGRYQWFVVNVWRGNTRF